MGPTPFSGTKYNDLWDRPLFKYNDLWDRPLLLKTNELAPNITIYGTDPFLWDRPLFLFYGTDPFSLLKTNELAPNITIYGTDPFSDPFSMGPTPFDPF